ncbi:uncharacterized protein SCHCODRAFT_02499047 [Schizophyllum commune H4-8]|uniref:uncharacterized protein n=1 Tax=Schizophyllum commune (strain H4-8 / FGSC 9210) TaxID=578458 RepID=UPI00215EA132|nr:uncharacterized protein SCHCODRAFT_02499047 [Schizophyllum commune H4-8]KAI5893296.1 hypothetical protein SCHCODRAFT_02499047 [Schizophyllum commune H4-8]
MADPYSYNEAAIRAYSISIAEHTLKQYRALLKHHDALLKQQEVALQRQKTRSASGRGTPTVHARAQLEKSVHDVEQLEARLKMLRVDDREASPPPVARKAPAPKKSEPGRGQTRRVARGDDRGLADAPKREAVDIVEALMAHLGAALMADEPARACPARSCVSR